MGSSDHSIPLAVVPKDQLREGLASFKDEAKIVHPVQKMLESSQKMTRTRLQEQVYGSALPAKASIEKQILSRIERLPGLPTSKLGLESLNGTLDRFSFESYIPSHEEKGDLMADRHAMMESRLGLH